MGVAPQPIADTHGPSRREASAGHPGFRGCLAMPPGRYAHLLADVGPDLDAQLAKTLHDYKAGRYHQASKRFVHLKAAQGFVADVPLIQQLAALSEAQAPMLIFELLFQLTGNDTTLEDSFWRYLDTIACFDPDDAIGHGALYNVLILFALRRSDSSMAERLCQLADDAYARCGSDYLRGFVHMHQALISVYEGRLEAALAAIGRAAGFFGATAQAECEQAMVEITRLWIVAEAEGALPSFAELQPLKEKLIGGEFWPETYLILAALELRASEDDKLALRYHGELESILRIRGMTHLLPVMQLMREDFLRRRAGDHSILRDHPGVSERHVMLLLPDADMVITNWGNAIEQVPLAFDRTRAARALALGRRQLVAGRFEMAAPQMWAALDVIEAQGWTLLALRERDTIALFCKECLVRRRFADRARWVRDTLLAGLNGSVQSEGPPDELTIAEFGIVKRLPGLTNNKLLAREMGVSEAAVKFHLRNIYRKLGVHSRSDAQVAATSRGWISPAHSHSGR